MGLFGSLGKLVGKGIKAVAPHIPGVGLVTGPLANRLIKKDIKKTVLAGAAGATAAVTSFAKSPGGKMAMIGAGGLAAGAGAAALMRGGGGGRTYRRINPGNTRAMRRAIRRIEAGARIYSKFFGLRHAHIKGAPGVHVKKLSIRRRAA